MGFLPRGEETLHEGGEPSAHRRAEPSGSLGYRESMEGRPGWGGPP